MLQPACPAAPPGCLQVIDNNLNPQWKPFRASMAQLCNCDEHRPLKIEVRWEACLASRA